MQVKHWGANAKMIKDTILSFPETEQREGEKMFFLEQIFTNLDDCLNTFNSQ